MNFHLVQTVDITPIFGMLLAGKSLQKNRYCNKLTPIVVWIVKPMMIAAARLPLAYIMMLFASSCQPAACQKWTLNNEGSHRTDDKDGCHNINVIFLIGCYCLVIFYLVPLHHCSQQMVITLVKMMKKPTS